MAPGREHDYLVESGVGAALEEGLAACVTLQPADPVTWLGEWLRVKADLIEKEEEAEKEVVAPPAKQEIDASSAAETEEAKEPTEPLGQEKQGEEEQIEKDEEKAPEGAVAVASVAVTPANDEEEKTDSIAAASAPGTAGQEEDAKEPEAPEDPAKTEEVPPAADEGERPAEAGGDLEPPSS